MSLPDIQHPGPAVALAIADCALFEMSRPEIAALKAELLRRCEESGGKWMWLRRINTMEWVLERTG